MMPRKIWVGPALFFAVSILIILSLFLGGHRFVRGAWIDRALSGALSSETGLQVRLYDVRFPERKPAMQFGILSVLDTKKSKVLFVAASGRAVLLSEFSSGDPAKRFKVRLEDAVIMEDLCRKNPLIDWASRQAFNAPIILKTVGIVFKKIQKRTIIRIISCRSEHLLLKGGLALDGTRITKAHFLVLLPEEKFEKVPKEMRARMIHRKGRWRGVRVMYRDNLFTAAGDSGPFFQAQWNHGQG